MKVNEMIYTGSKWFNQRIFIESSGDKKVDKALKSTFHDGFHKTHPLEMRRADVRICLEYQGTKARPRGSI